MSDNGEIPYSPRPRPRIVDQAERMAMPPGRAEPAFEAHADALTDAMRRAARADQTPAAPMPVPVRPTGAGDPDDLVAPILDNIANDIRWMPWAQTEKLALEIFGEPGKAAQLIGWTEKRLNRGDAA